MSDVNKVVLVKLVPGQELACRVEEKDNVVVLIRPAVVIMTPTGPGLDNWPMFIDDKCEKRIEVLREHILCVVPVHEKLEEAYLKFLGETTILTPQKPGLILPQ